MFFLYINFNIIMYNIEVFNYDFMHTFLDYLHITYIALFNY